MKKLVVFSMVLFFMGMPVQVGAENPYGLFNYEKNDNHYYGNNYPDCNAEQDQVPQWVLMSMRNQVAKRLHQEFGSDFHFIQDDPNNSNAFFIDAVGDNGRYWSYIELTRVPQPKPWNPGLFQIQGYGVANNEFFLVYGFFSNGLKLKVVRETEF